MNQYDTNQIQIDVTELIGVQG